ncbi:MAG TPA: MBL fold metallo-hydrolase [Gaiellaceae bacterium]|nr:MBL fold metallo-hydrolase [Gaiellaceae bacterium]
MALAVDRYELGQIGTNCYVVRRETGAPELVVVDPGDDAATLRLELARIEGTVAAILVTHTHYDHIGAVAELAGATGAPVYVSGTEAQVVADPDAFYPAMRIRAWQPEHTLAGDETLELAGIEFQTVAVPGHSPGHLAYYADGSLFSGDVLFAGSVGRVDLPYGDWETLLESIRTLVDRFPPDTIVYSGHGPPTTLGAELARNPFLAELRA